MKFRFGIAGLAAALVGSFVATAGAVVIPNANFDTLYKPGSTTITATIADGYTSGIGPGRGVNGTASYSDGTTGGSVDIPGWSGGGATGVQGFAAGAGQFTAGADTLPNAVYVQGPDFGGPANDFITSDPLGPISANNNYILSIRVGDRSDVNPQATPIVLNLNANGAALSPDAASSPALVSGGFVTFTRTFNAASLAAFVGQSMTISFGVGANPSGQQAEFDSVALSAIPVPEPSSVALAMCGAIGLLAVGSRRPVSQA